MLHRILRSEVKNDRDLILFVAAITGVSLVLALSLDVFLHLVVMRSSLDAAITSWIGTTVITIVVAAPVSRTVGIAYRKLHHARQEVLRQSRTDEMTGLPNRRVFVERTRAAEPLTAVVVFDLDRFKSINDGHGHDVGDDVIRGTAERLSGVLGGCGLLCRFGGEEFVWLPTAGDPAVVLAAAEAARHAVEREPIRTGAGPIRITISAGVAIRQDDEPFKRIFAAADHALYRAKRMGRNRVVLDLGSDPSARIEDDLEAGDLHWLDRQSPAAAE